MKYILSFSGGKDSTFLLLELIRRKYPFDEVVFFDTGWEFPVMYKHIERCKKICEEHGIKFVTLHPKKSFDYLMFQKPVLERKSRKFHFGYSWCGGSCRWGTTEKNKALDAYATYEKSVVYIGIAADETSRLEKERAEYKCFPLAEWGITESECLQGCYDLVLIGAECMNILTDFHVNSAKIRISKNCGTFASTIPKYGKNSKTTSDGQTDRTKERDKAFLTLKSGLHLRTKEQPKGYQLQIENFIKN